MRADGRKPDELREMKIEAGVLKRADGSCYLEWGKNKVYTAVYGPREVFPRFLQNSERAILRCRYNMASFSVEDRKRPGPDRRSVEISKVMQGALEPALLLHLYPKSMIEVNVEIVQANAGTICAGITAASVALADAGIPMRDLVSACAAGKADDKIVLDLSKEEDNLGQADLPIALIPKTQEITLLQMDGILSEEELEKAIRLGMKGCMRIHELQKKALIEKYKGD
ncbi:MAG: exosome complex exonuclease Rrp41 [Candidatus Methanofastidiosia archaeon]